MKRTFSFFAALAFALSVPPVSADIGADGTPIVTGITCQLDPGVDFTGAEPCALVFVPAAVELCALEDEQSNCESPEETELKPAPEPAGDAVDVAPLIKQLDDDGFAQREAAVKKLAKMGAIAIPALAKATKGKSPEVSMRAFDIILRHYKGGDEEAKETAAGALQRIAESGKSFAARAKQALKPPKPAPRPGIQFRGQIAGNAGIQRRVAILLQKGVKQIDVEEDGRQVKILDDPQNGIKVEVTEEKEGKKETTKYEAQSVEELKEKHPEAHKLYQKYAGNARNRDGNIRIQIERVAP